MTGSIVVVVFVVYKQNEGIGGGKSFYLTD